MPVFETTITINAPAQVIWDILVDALSWPTWNTTIDKVDGDVALGKTVTVYAKVNPGRAFPVKVSKLTPPHRMVWIGGMPLGLFRGVRTYTLSSKGEHATDFTMHEAYSGPLAGMITRSIPDLQPAFDEFARSLKLKAEASR